MQEAYKRGKTSRGRRRDMHKWFQKVIIGYRRGYKIRAGAIGRRLLY